MACRTRFGHAALFAQSFTYDRAGRIVGKTEQANGLAESFAYGYDAAGRLASVSKNGAELTRYQYDANGNRTSDGVNNATYDAQDRLLQYGEASYTYSDNGELKSKRVGTAVTQYDYDVLGNLRKVVMPDGKVIEYVIDGRNRRIGRKVNGVLEFGLLYIDQLNPVAQMDGQGNVTARFVYGTRANVPDYMEKGGRTYRFVTDQLGSVRMVVDAATGEAAQTMDYDAYGQVLRDSNPGFQPFGFAGGLRDVDTGLTRFGVRDYDAVIGRWMAKDPIGFVGGESNLYSYAWQDPQDYIDPDGNFGVPGAIAGGIVGAIGGAVGAAANGGNVLRGALFGGLGGSLIGGLGPVIGPSLLGQMTARAAAGAVGNVIGQGQDIGSGKFCGFNTGSIIGSAVGGALAGIVAPASWGTPFAGPLASQLSQRALAGLPGAAVSGTAGVVGTQMGKR